jgi:hypothetical protein
MGGATASAPIALSVLTPQMSVKTPTLNALHKEGAKSQLNTLSTRLSSVSQHQSCGTGINSRKNPPSKPPATSGTKTRKH